MRLFSLTKEIAVDLGTANTIIIHNDKIVIDEPSIVASLSAKKLRRCRERNIPTSRPYVRCVKV